MDLKTRKTRRPYSEVLSQDDLDVTLNLTI